MTYLLSGKPRIFGHRGACGRYPENTLESFAAALEAGATALELDVHGTRDGEIVVLHDPDLSRTTDESGPVRDRSLQELRAVDAGAGFRTAAGDHPFRGVGLRIPTLDEVLAAFAGVPLNIEIKQESPSIEAKVVEKIAWHGASERVLLAAESHTIMQRIRRCSGDILTGSSAEEVLDFYTRLQSDSLAGYLPAGVALQVPHYYDDLEVVTERFVAAAHGAGLEVHVWTINEPREMHELLDLGVDGLMSDFPERIVQVVAERENRR